MAEGITDFSSQRPAIDIVAPALTRHVTFRLLRRENPRFVVLSTEWATILGSLRGHIQHIQQACGVSGREDVHFLEPYEQTTKKGLPGYSVSRSAIVTIHDDTAKNCRFRVRIDVYTELLSVTYVIDKIQAEAGADIAEKLASLYDPASKVPPDEAASGLNWLYDGAWRSDAAIPGATAIQDYFSAKREVRGFGNCLSDFRGVVVVSNTATKKAGADTLGLDVASEADASDDPNDSDDQPNTLAATKELVPGLRRFYNRHKASGLIDRITGRGDGAGRSPMAGEQVVCGMLDGEALYIAELGKRNAADTIEPVKHLLVFEDAPGEQVGRLIRRLHVLGELRHAALMDYDNGKREPAPSGEQREQPLNGDGDTGASSAEPAVDLKTISRKLRDISRALDEELVQSSGESNVQAMSALIVQVGQLKTGAEEDGLSYRIDQSRYYATQFTKSVPHLRIVRIRYCQSYDDFVARFIYQLFARIERIGVRYDAFLRRLILLTSFRISKEIEAYQKNVEGSLGKLEVAVGNLAVATREVTNATREVTGATREVTDATREVTDATREVKEAMHTVIKASSDQIALANKHTSLLNEASALGILIAVHYLGTTINDSYEVHGTLSEAPIVSHGAFMTGWVVVMAILFSFVAVSYLVRKTKEWTAR